MPAWEGARRARRRRNQWRQAVASFYRGAMPSTERSGAALDSTRRYRHPGAPAPENTLRSLITSLKLPGVVGGCVSLCGRPPSDAPVSPGMVTPPTGSGCAHTHAKHTRRFLLFWCVICQNGEICDITPARNGPVAPLGRCPPLRNIETPF